MWFSVFFFFFNCEHLVLAPNLGLGQKPHIWNVCFVFPLTGDYLACFICFPWLAWPSLTSPQAPGLSPVSGRESLPACPTGSFCALITRGWWRPLKLTPHKVDLGRNPGTELGGRKLANSPQWCQSERFLPALCTSHRRQPWRYRYSELTLYVSLQCVSVIAEPVLTY